MAVIGADCVTLPALLSVKIFSPASSKPVTSIPPVVLSNVKLSMSDNAPIVILPVPSSRPMVMFEKPSAKLVAKYEAEISNMPAPPAIPMVVSKVLG